jgi:hypothetical protein
MSESITHNTELPENELVFLSCLDCDRVTRHQIHAVTKSHWSDGNVDLWNQHQIVQCQGCLTISFCETSQFSENWDVDPETGETYIPTTRKQYPENSDGRDSLNEIHLLPDGVLKIYEETLSSLNSKLNVMVGFGIRAIVEAICIDKTVSGGNLKIKINNLQQEGYVTTDGADILHSLRFMGNNAVHEMKEHDIKELNAAFDVIEHMLNGVYVLPELAKKLPKNS